MIDSMFSELINRAIDKDLSREELEKLNEYLSNNPEAKKYYNRCLHMKNLLDKAEEVEPDPSLKNNILYTIKHRHSQVTEKEGILQKILKRFEYRVQLKYAFFFAAGIVFGLLILTFVGDLGGKYHDKSDFIGTLLMNEKGDELKTADNFKFEKNDILGESVLKFSDKYIVQQINISSLENVDISLQYNKDELSFAGFKQLENVKNTIKIEEDFLEMRNNGHNNYVIIFKKLKKSSLSGIKFKISGSGVTLFEKKILPF